MKKLILFATAALAVALSSPAMAYGQFGHGTIARIAMANVSPAVRARVIASRN